MKLPAYGKRLLESRRAGVHPASVTVIYGLDWQVAEGITRLAVKPGEALGLDWRCVVGLPVELVQRFVPDPMLPNPWPDREFYVLAGEIAPLSAGVTLMDADGTRRCASLLAFTCKCWNASTRRMEWPAWWSEEIEQQHGENWQRWIEEAAHIARQAA